MAVQVRLARANTTPTTSPQTISASGFTDGDLILLEVRHTSHGLTVTPPAGFTLLYSVAPGTTDNEIRLYAKIANGESGSYSVSWTGGSGANTARLGIVALYSDAGKPLVQDGHATRDNTSASTNLTCPSVTTTTAGAMLVCFVAIFNAVTTTAPGSMTKQYDSSGTSSIAAFTETISSPGATGTRTPTGGSAQSSRTISIAYAEMPAPSAPSDLEADALTASRVDLSWTDNASGVGNEDHFSLERSLNGSTGWTEIATPAADETTYSDTGLAANTNYYYRIKAVNGGGESSYSEIAHALTLLALAPVSKPRIFILNPTVIFAARVVVLDPPTYPVVFVAYDTVTTGAYTDIQDGMTVLLGTAPGLDDLGKQRVRGAPTAISIFVGRSSRGVFEGELTLVDDAYLTVVDERRIWARMPFIDGDGRIFKDSDLEVSDRTTYPPPVANCGESTAATINADGVIIVHLPGEESFAVADGATITDYAWDIKDGTLLPGSELSDPSVDVTFPAGYRYPELTVTDSNGKSHTASCLVVADDPDNRLSFEGFDIDSITITDAGQTMTIRAREDMPRATYRDGAQVIVWDREPDGASNRDHVLICGWLGDEESSVSQEGRGLLRDTQLTILDGGAKLDTLPGLPQQVADDDSRDITKLPEMTWNYMVAPNMDKYIHYLLCWHSTALEVMNFTFSGTGSAFRLVTKTSDGESLWQQVANLAKAMCPGYVLTINRAGGMAVVPDPQLRDLADRTNVVQRPITEDDFSEMRVNRRGAPVNHWRHGGAILVQSGVAFDTDGNLYLPTVFSKAPGLTPGQGLGEVENNEQLVASQDVLNSATGHQYARDNSPIISIELTLVQDDSAPHSAVPWRDIEPARKEWVTLSLSAEYAAQRGLTFTNARCLPKQLEIRYPNYRTGRPREIQLTLEPETVGQPGATYIMPTVPAVGEEPEVIPDPIPPPDMGLIEGQGLIAAIGLTSLYRTSDFDTASGDGGPTWEEISLTEEEIMTWVVDPFSPGYIEGAGAINGFFATAENICRVSDMFGTVIASIILEFGTPALWRTIQASFGTYFTEGNNPWLICISYYGNAAGHTGTYATYSKDGGATWADEVQVSAFYDSGGAVNPIGLYCSPKTPGLAYTVAHLETANPAEAGGYVSVDYGATWAAMPAEEDSGEPLPLLGEFYDTNPSITTGSQTYNEVGRVPSATIARSISGTGGASEGWGDSLGIAPPANARRITIAGTFTGYADWSGFGNAGYTNVQSYKKGTYVSRTVISDTNNGMTGKGQTFERNFIYQYDFSDYVAHDWPDNRDILEADPSPLDSDYAIYFRTSVNHVATGTWSASYSLSLRVIEIILDDGTTYIPKTPGIIVPLNGMGGEIHLPWADNAAEDVIYSGQLNRSGNRQFALIRAVAGTVEDVSPNSGGVDYGINHGHFAVRCHDSDRTLVLLAGTGNDASGSESGDKQGVWISIDGGDSWDEIIAPSTGTEPYSAAFSGSLDGIVYIWGPAGYFGYSDDNGASVDDRSGNLAALSATKLIGIAGGPTP